MIPFPSHLFSRRVDAVFALGLVVFALFLLLLVVVPLLLDPPERFPRPHVAEACEVRCAVFGMSAHLRHEEGWRCFCDPDGVE